MKENNVFDERHFFIINGLHLCVCVCEREREREREKGLTKLSLGQLPVAPSIDSNVVTTRERSNVAAFFGTAVHSTCDSFRCRRNREEKKQS